MYNLHLASPDRSDLEFKISKFPDGQQSIAITGWGPVQVKKSCGMPMEKIEEYLPTVEVLIQSRFNNFKDLEVIICATQALKRLGVTTIHLFVPYLLGARSDRQFKTGEPSYLVDVIAPVLNEQEYASVCSIDVHSDVAAACIKNFISVSNMRLVEWAIQDIWDSGKADGTIEVETIKEQIAVVSPDAGSLKKIYKVVEAIGFKGDVIQCTKDRGPDGKLSKITVHLGLEHENVDLVLVDDICDGGRTFIEEAKVIKGMGHTGKLYLVVTHGIFSAGLDELYTYFDRIYTTTSVKDFGAEKFMPPVEGEHLTYKAVDVSEFVKQLEIF